MLLAGGLLAGGAAVAFLWSRPAEERADVAAAPALPSVRDVDVRETPFTPWMRFEPPGQHADYFSRFYVDAVLGHQVFKIPPRGLPAHQARALLLDDDDLLLSSGAKLFNRESLSQPGMVGRFCYTHSDYCLKRLFEVQFTIDGQPVVIYDNHYTIERFPSRTSVRYVLGPVVIDEHKYITNDDRAVATYDVRSTDGQPHTVGIHVLAQYLTVPYSTGPTTYPLLAHGNYRQRPLYIYLDAPEFEPLSTGPIHLVRELGTGPGGSQRANVAVSFENAERVGGEPLPRDLFERHVAAYQRWFFDNVPYFDAPDGLVKKMWYYRWWIVRLHLTVPETEDIQGYSFYEGKLGFDNAITFAVPVQLKELTYLRDPVYALDQARNAYRNTTESGAIVDPPSSPYWGENYSHWSAAALAEMHRVHPLAADELRRLLPAVAADVRGWLHAFDKDGDLLPSRDVPRVTGYDLDILSYWWWNGLKLDLYSRTPDLERVDFASFVYANARGTAELARAAGDEALAKEFDSLADGIRAAALEAFWDSETGFFYPRNAADHERIPVRELHGLFPFAMQLAPDEPKYHSALRKLVDPTEFWSRYPPVITSMAHYRDWTWTMDGLTRNIAPHPISMGAFTAMRAMQDYRQDIVTPAHFMAMMRSYTELMYPRVLAQDPSWRPNAHEYYSEWEPGARSPYPKPSDISHDFHSMYNALVVEGMVGLRPRVDDRIELRPAAHEWDYFALDRVRHRGRDLTIVWDRPDGTVHYQGFPEGLSLYVDGVLAFTRPNLRPVVYDPTSGEVRDAE